MMIVATVDNKALLRCAEEAGTAPGQRDLSAAIPVLAALAREHDLVLACPLETIANGIRGTIAHWLIRELTGALPGHDLLAVLTRTVVDRDDPAFYEPHTFVGPALDAHTAAVGAVRHGWQVRRDGPHWRRVVATPLPRDIVELPILRGLVDDGVLVVASGGAVVVRAADATLRGVEAFVDHDHAAAVLALGLKADLLLLLTDGPNAAAARRFVDSGSGRAAIGPLSAAAELVAGNAGIQITNGGAS